MFKEEGGSKNTERHMDTLHKYIYMSNILI